jgi:hypothetical protein
VLQGQVAMAGQKAVSGAGVFVSEEAAPGSHSPCLPPWPQVPSLGVGVLGPGQCESGLWSLSFLL